MTPRDFCYWLQGFFEIADPEEVTFEEVQRIKDHLNLVFEKKTPEAKTITIYHPGVSDRINEVYPVETPIDMTPKITCSNARTVSTGDLSEEVKDLDVPMSC